MRNSPNVLASGWVDDRDGAAGSGLGPITSMKSDTSEYMMISATSSFPRKRNQTRTVSLARTRFRGVTMICAKRVSIDDFLQLRLQHEV
jgi:hypothetical protein